LVLLFQRYAHVETDRQTDTLIALLRSPTEVEYTEGISGLSVAIGRNSWVEMGE